MLRSIKDVVDAVDNGRVHTQRFFKNINTVGGDNSWTDWSYSSGQPAYDARIGDATTFTPSIAVRNDAIWFPGMQTGMERRLLEMNLYSTGSGAGQGWIEAAMYDLVGYYPLIDGDSTDQQDMDNTLTLPRYTTGEGVRVALVNHVAPALANATFTMVYTNSDGVSGRTVTGDATPYGITKACYTMITSIISGPIYVPLAPGDKGVRSIESFQFDSAPGGLFCLYMVKPVAQLGNRHGGGANGATDRVVTETNFLTQGGFKAPLIPDGAALGFFVLTGPSGSNRFFSIYGNATFIWG